MKQTVCKVLKIFQYGKYLVAYVLNSKKFNLCMYILRTEKQDGSKLTFMPFKIDSIYV